MSDGILERSKKQEKRWSLSLLHASCDTMSDINESSLEEVKTGISPLVSIVESVLD